MHHDFNKHKNPKELLANLPTPDRPQYSEEYLAAQDFMAEIAASKNQSDDTEASKIRLRPSKLKKRLREKRHTEAFYRLHTWFIGAMGSNWRGVLRFRAILAVGCVIIGIMGSLYHPGGTNGWVAARTMPPGHTVEDGDFIAAQIRPEPHQMVRVNPKGRVTTQPFTKGQSAVEPAFLGTDFSELFPDYELVPIMLSDAGNSTMLHAGDIVSVVALVGNETHVIANDVMVAVAAQPRLLIALPQDEAYQLAAASLKLPLTVVLKTTRDSW
ncbi:MAG: hypothetical protein Q3972_02470 [Corynebacterium sp.]|nr:hypothetical protein [Corynebacterium sp.]